MKITVSQIEKAIKMSSKKWVGNCYSIAYKILKSGIVKGKLRYGHFLGKVKEGTLFDNGIRFSRHGWIEKKDGTIIDATRWVFEGKKPYIYIRKDLDNEYDAGGQEWRKSVMKPPPEFDGSKEIKLLVSDEIKMFILNQLEYPYITAKGLFWIANLSTDILGDFAREIYDALEKENLRAFIPIDNYNIVIT